MFIDWQMVSVIVAAIGLPSVYFAYRHHQASKPSLHFIQAVNRTKIVLRLATKSSPIEVKRIYVRKRFVRMFWGRRIPVEWSYPKLPNGTPRLVTISQDDYIIHLPKKCDSKGKYKIYVSTSGGSCSVVQGYNDHVV
jgi:hypothetical protein